MNFADFRDQYECRVSAAPLWTRHPFFVGLKERSATGVLGTWMIQGGKVEELFPRLLQTALDNDVIPEELKRAIRENLDDELGNGMDAQAHFALYRNALAALGIAFGEYARTEPAAATRALLRGLFGGAASSDPVEALSRLATEELLPPAEFPHLVRALAECGGGPTRPRWEPYFIVHIDGDREHASELIESLYRVIGSDRERMKTAFDVQAEHLRENERFYDWLCEESGLA